MGAVAGVGGVLRDEVRGGTGYDCRAGKAQKLSGSKMQEQIEYKENDQFWGRSEQQ